MAIAPNLPARRARLAGHLFALAFIAVWAGYGAMVESYTMPGPWLVAERLVIFFGDVHELKHMFLFVRPHYRGRGFVVCDRNGTGVFGILRARLRADGTWPASTLPELVFSGIGWTFLAIIWFGISDITVVFVISMVLVPFAIINMREGLANLDAERIEMAASFTRGPWRRFVLVVLPSLFPFIFATIRISFGVAWKVALTAELFGGNTGLGYLLNLARQDFDMPLILAVILIIIAFVYSTDRWIFAPIQSRLARHHGTV